MKISKSFIIYIHIIVLSLTSQNLIRAEDFSKNVIIHEKPQIISELKFKDSNLQDVDLINKRGDWKTNMSKLIYYGAVQNFIFNALQQALFALGFDSDEEKEKQKEKYQNILNSMLDSILRGTGVAGNAVMVGKNFAMDLAKRAQKPRPNFSDAAWKLLDISPPLDSKLTKIRSALYTLDYEGDKMIEDGISLDNPAAMASAQVISATTNIPLDRVMRLYDNTRAAVASDTEAWQRVALLLGWSTWELGMQDEKTEKIQRKKGRTIVKRKIK